MVIPVSLNTSETVTLPMSKSAIILGATGLTGSLVLKELLSDNRYDRILLFSRSACGIEHSKIEEHLVDVLNLEEAKAQFSADEVYCCIGTTKKKTPDANLYRKIDFGIPSSAASIAKENGVIAFAVISAIGADSKSSIAYNRIKGDMEQAVLEANIEHTYILRPSIISGNRKEKRLGEKIGIFVFQLLKPFFFGKLKKYRAVEAKAIARRMIQLCNSNEKSQIVESDAI